MSDDADGSMDASGGGGFGSPSFMDGDMDGDAVDGLEGSIIEDRDPLLSTLDEPV